MLPFVAPSDGQGLSTSSVNRLCASTTQLPPEDQQPIVKVYKRRWIMLFIYVLVYMTNAFSWLQYSIITDVAMKYYVRNRFNFFSIDVTPRRLRSDFTASRVRP